MASRIHRISATHPSPSAPPSLTREGSCRDPAFVYIQSVPGGFLGVENEKHNIGYSSVAFGATFPHKGRLLQRPRVCLHSVGFRWLFGCGKRETYYVKPSLVREGKRGAFPFGKCSFYRLLIRRLRRHLPSQGKALAETPRLFTFSRFPVAFRVWKMRNILRKAFPCEGRWHPPKAGDG